jgi:hypothetical protein
LTGIRAFILLTAATASLAAQTTAPPAPSSPTRFQGAINAYLKADSTARPAPDGIVFIGSSIFAQWTQVSEHMTPLPVYNRAFGGSQTPDVLYYMNDVVLPYKPKFVVYYCGSNDVNARRPATDIVSNIREFHERVQRALPGTRMFFVSVLKSPEKRTRWAVVDSVNTAMRAYITRASNIEYIDLNPVLLDAKGETRGELYRPDSLHYVPSTYDLFASVIKPVLQRAWAAR